jgi:uncharacterized protein YjiS (DUF1127 family)
MPALTSLAIGAIRTLAAHAAGPFRRLVRALKNRRDAHRLASLDDRMLADIGLTRGDLQDAYAEPLWQDPTDVLAERVAERRGSRRKAAACPASTRTLVPAVDTLRYPAADRPARYLM